MIIRKELLKERIKQRLIKHINFLEDELKDYEIFKSLTWEEYRSNRSKRRDVERWIENIINSSIDIAKVILASETIALSDTYREIVASLALVHGFAKKDMDKLSTWVRLRNVITHEYLDIKWASIKKFISEAEPQYQTFLKHTKNYLDKKLRED
jgi:uncharacterized protein YutE (UPF0331/DUF86 family)